MTPERAGRALGSELRDQGVEESDGAQQIDGAVADDADGAVDPAEQEGAGERKGADFQATSPREASISSPSGDLDFRWPIG